MRVTAVHEGLAPLGAHAVEISVGRPSHGGWGASGRPHRPAPPEGRGRSWGSGWPAGGAHRASPHRSPWNHVGGTAPHGAPGEPALGGLAPAAILAGEELVEVVWVVGVVQTFDGTLGVREG